MAAGPREAIQTFASLLHGVGIPRTHSEVFRQAKFNHFSVYSELLELLYRLVPLVSLLNNTTPDHSPTLDQITNTISKILPSKQWMLLTIQKLFYHLGYSTIDFYHNCTSRELLLGLGWLVCETNIMKKLKHCVVQSARRSILDQSLAVLADKMQHEYILNTQELSRLQDSDSLRTSDSLQELVLLNGRLHRQVTRLERLSETYRKLERRVQSSTEGRLRVHEGYILSHSKVYSVCMRHLEAHASVMVLLLKWEAVSDVFKKWIESVAELKVKEQGPVSGGLNKDELQKRVKELQVSVSRLLKENNGYIENVKKLRKFTASDEQAAASDPLIVALKGLKYDCSVSDIDWLRTRLESLVNDKVWCGDRRPLSELTEEVDRKQSQVLAELESLQDTVPGTISVKPTLRCTGF